MTIYECLGLDGMLLNEYIPVDLVIENIDRADMRDDARVFFQDVAHISIRASLMRAGHYLQVIEVGVNNATHINEISFLIQKAIRYQVLFVFVYEERYLLVRRSFNLTMSTEHVYSDYTSFCSDWIYKEALEEDNLAYLHIEDISDAYEEDFELAYHYNQTDSDNGDHLYFTDVMYNAEQLNQAVVYSDYICLRYLLDWLETHAAGERIGIYDILERVRSNEAYYTVGEYLFLEKSHVSGVISFLDRSEYSLSLGHTGKHPMFYFKAGMTPATYDAANALKRFLVFGDDSVAWCAEDDDEWGIVKKKQHLAIRDSETQEQAAINTRYVQNKVALKKAFTQLNLPGLLSKRQEYELAQKIANGDQEARRLFILSNVRLVYSVVKNYGWSTVPMDDLFQEGMLGLITAVNRFDRWRDTKFSTYATPWIKQAIQRAIDDKSSLVRLPVYLCELISKVYKARSVLREVLGKEPTAQDISEHLSVPLRKIQEAILYSEEFVISYDEPINGTREALVEQLTATHFEPVHTLAENNVLHGMLEDVLDSLTERESKVLKLRCGFMDGRPRTLEEVGKEFELTRERILQIEHKALRKMRHPSRCKRLVSYMDVEEYTWGLKTEVKRKF